MSREKSRLEAQWNKEIRIALPLNYSPKDKEEPKLDNLLKSGKFASKYKDPEHSLNDLIKSSKEIVIDFKDEKLEITFITYALDYSTLELVISEDWKIVDDFQSLDERKEFLKEILGFADVDNVPVYPNRQDVEYLIAECYKDLLINGFLIKKEEDSEEMIRIRPADSPGSKIEDIEYLLNKGSNTSISQAEQIILKQSFSKKLSDLAPAAQVLESLKAAITELNVLLCDRSRNENAIQDCLTRNPILFGLEYCQVIPKHRFGSDFVSDYALRKHSGLCDIVEIESSCLKLYTKKGNPRKDLVHAEQQVLDWLDWIEAHNPYATSKLTGLSSPIGFVIIGRSEDLNEDDRKRLHRRNLSFRGALVVMTYDDFLERARNILKILKGTNH